MSHGPFPCATLTEHIIAVIETVWKTVHMGNGDCGLQNLKIFTICPFIEKVFWLSYQKEIRLQKTKATKTWHSGYLPLKTGVGKTWDYGLLLSGSGNRISFNREIHFHKQNCNVVWYGFTFLNKLKQNTDYLILITGQNTNITSLDNLEGVCEGVYWCREWGFLL